MFDRDILDRAKAALDAARRRKLTLATAESCTGGLVAAALTVVPGTSDVLDGGFVTYSNAAKTRMLGVPADLIARHGAVSEQVAAAMAEGAIDRCGVDLAVSVTGVAGPGGGSEHKPVGLVRVGAVGPAGMVTLERRFGDLGRDGVRWAALIQALDLLLDRATA
jgi:nicotinamide-nucleotide amidase